MREKALNSMKKHMAEYDSEEESEEGESGEEGKEKEPTKQAQPNPTTGPKPVEGDGKPVTMRDRLMATLNPSKVTKPRIKKITCIYTAAGGEEECGLNVKTMEEFHKHIKEVHEYELTGHLRWESTKVQSGYTAEELEGLELKGKKRTVATKRKPEEDDDVRSTPQAGQKEKKTRKHGRGRSRSRKVRSASETPPRIARRKIMFNADAKKGAVDTRAESPAAANNQALSSKVKTKQQKTVTLKPEEAIAIQTSNQEEESEAEEIAAEARKGEDNNKDLDFRPIQDKVEEMNLGEEPSGEELQANAVVPPLTAEQQPDPSPETEALEASKELEKEIQEEGKAMKNWTQKNVDAKHILLGEISQMNEVLEQLPEIMEGDAFSLTNATRDEDETGKKDERDDVPPPCNY